MRMLIRSLMRWLSIACVSAYLCGAGLFLLLTGRIRSPGFMRLVLARFRKAYQGDVDELRHEEGHCYLTAVPSHLVSDRESRSSLVLLENGRPLARAHAPHDDIRHIGQGRYSHWGKHVYFSSSDNSDPARNQRHYSIVEQR